MQAYQKPTIFTLSLTDTSLDAALRVAKAAGCECQCQCQCQCQSQGVE